MAPHASSMTRSSSSDSSALSNILVAGAQEDDSASDRVSASTPPTSLNDSGSLGSAKAAVDTMDVVEEEGGRRPKRSRSSVSTYNLKKLSEGQKAETAGSSRNVSGLTGHTLVGDEYDYAALASKVDKDIDMEWESTALSPQRRSPRNLQRKQSVKDRVKKAASKVGSVLGKRSREVMEAGKRKLGMREEEEASPQQKKVLKELETGTKGVLDELDLSDEEWDVPPPRPAKKVKIERAILQDTKQTVPTAPPLKISSGKTTKKWQKEGLYSGQHADFDPTKGGGRKKLQKKRPGSSSDATDSNDAPPKQTSFMTLPMFSYLDKTRDFIIPFDIYAPSARKGDEKPKDWHKVNRNRLVGEAKELWEKAEKLPSSVCVCRVPATGEQGCGDDCLNRVMQYECNDDNCGLSAPQCSNRAFAELAARTKKGGAFDIGVEVIKTANRGFGVRSCRTFAPGQIIMEYTGEIISEGECQRRMREDYKDKQCYYLMELERGLIIDGTKGSMARFINHSCSPNCEVRMMKVSGTPRMAVFAGEAGIMTGQELTYDYNFDSFGATKQLCYCGAPNCRGTLSKRLNAAEQKKQAREESERKRKAAEEAQKHAAAEAKKKQVKDDRGASWRGWVAVDDPETKEQLKREKKEKEEAGKNSARAKRLAQRRDTLPAPKTRQAPAVVKKNDSKRRKTAQVDGTDGPEEHVAETMNEQSTSTSTSTKTHVRTVSTSSKSTEEIKRPASAHSTATIIKHTEESVSTTEVHEETRPLNDDFTFEGADDTSNMESATEKTSLARTASKGKEALKNVGQAVRSSILGLDKSKSGIGGNGKLRQSTLSFAKLS